MYKKLLVMSVILGLASLSLRSQLQIQELKNNQAELNKAIEKNTEINSSPKKTLLDQVRENSNKRIPVVIQNQKDQYIEPFNSSDHSKSEIQFKLPTPTTGISYTEKWEQERRQKCQEDINKYNTCINEYNSEMTEYNACQTECNTPNSITGKISQYCYCSKPYNSCSKPWCMGL